MTEKARVSLRDRLLAVMSVQGRGFWRVGDFVNIDSPVFMAGVVVEAVSVELKAMHAAGMLEHNGKGRYRLLPSHRLDSTRQAEILTEPVSADEEPAEPEDEAAVQLLEEEASAKIVDDRVPVLNLLQALGVPGRNADAESRTVDLGSGTLTLSIDGSFMALTSRDRELVCALLDIVDDYEGAKNE